MKNIFKSIIMTMLIFTSIQINAQNNTEAELQGTWTIDYAKTLAEIDSNNTGAFEAMNERRRNQIENTHKGRTLSLLSNGTFTQKLTDGRESNGSWYIFGNKLDLVSSKNTRAEFKIHKINANTLVLKTRNYGEAKPMFKYLHFNKTNP